MSRIKRVIIFLILLIIPVFVLADSFSYEQTKANSYITKGSYKSTYERYINLNAISQSEKDDNFINGSFLSKQEYEISLINNKSYLYVGTPYWSRSKNSGSYYVVGTNTYKGASSDYYSRVTEYVKKGTRVKGIGTATDPWVFVPQYRVHFVLNSNDYGSIDQAELYYEKNSDVRVIIRPNPGYSYIRNSCGAELVGNNVLSLIVKKDVECTVVLGYKLYEITNGESEYSVVPKKMYLRYNDDYYLDESEETIAKKIDVSNIEKPIGKTFDGLEYIRLEGNVLVVGPDGTIDKSTVDKITGDTTLKVKWKNDSYLVTFDSNGGTTPNVLNKTVFYSEPYGELPTTTKFGYNFVGWYTGKTDGNKVTETTEVTTALNHTLFARWERKQISCLAGYYLAANTESCSICKVNNYCPNNATYNFDEVNDQGLVPCPSGMNSDVGSKTKAECKITCSEGEYLVKGTSSCTECIKGNKCPGNTCNYSDTTDCGISQCSAGTYSLAGSSYCTNCAEGTYQNKAGQDKCNGCTPTGSTGVNGTTTGAGQTSCNSGCDGERAVEWETSIWNNNNPQNVCTIKTCETGYVVDSNNKNKCVLATVTATVIGFPNNTVTVDGETYNLDSKGKTTITVNQGNHVFKDGYREDNVKTLNVTEGATIYIGYYFNVRHYPEGAWTADSSLTDACKKNISVCYGGTSGNVGWAKPSDNASSSAKSKTTTNTSTVTLPTGFVYSKIYITGDFRSYQNIYGLGKSSATAVGPKVDASSTVKVLQGGSEITSQKVNSNLAKSDKFTFKYSTETYSKDTYWNEDYCCNASNAKFRKGDPASISMINDLSYIDSSQIGISTTTVIDQKSCSASSSASCYQYVWKYRSGGRTILDVYVY